jgi:hypothetical protein
MGLLDWLDQAVGGGVNGGSGGPPPMPHMMQPGPGAMRAPPPMPPMQGMDGPPPMMPPPMPPAMASAPMGARPPMMAPPVPPQGYGDQPSMESVDADEARNSAAARLQVLMRGRRDAAAPNMDPMTSGGLPTPPHIPVPAGAPPMQPPVPPMQPPVPPMGDAGLALGGLGGGVPPGPVPLPQQRPAMPAASPPMPPGDPVRLAPPTPGAPIQLPPGAEAMPRSRTVGQGDSNVGLLGRAFGLDPSSDRRMRNALAAGLTAVGSSAGKSGMEAFASGAGAALTGAEKSDQTEQDQKVKLLNAAISAQARGDEAKAKQLQQQYLAFGAKQRVVEHTDKMAREDARIANQREGKGASGKPEYQRILDAEKAISSNPTLTAQRKKVEALSKDRFAKPEEVAAAMAALQQQENDLRLRMLKVVEVNPAKAAMLSGMGTSPDKPIPLTPDTKPEDFDLYVEPGGYYTNPKDGKVYQRESSTKKNPAGAPASGSASPSSAVSDARAEMSSEDDDDGKDD